MTNDMSRRNVLQGAAMLGPLVYGTPAWSAQEPASKERMTKQGTSRMNTYIGTATSRVDGGLKVTGGAKYAADFNQNGLAYGAVVTSTIAKGHIASIDTGAALRVGGVLAVLTHENRPPMAEAFEAYNDEVAPSGRPFRPLYDGTIFFDGQPIAFVLAEDWETARFAASLVRVDYQAQPHMTDLQAARNTAFPVEKPEKPRGNAETAFAAAAVRHEAEYFIPIEHHNPIELFASTAIWDGDSTLTVYDKTQGVQNVQRYLRNVFGMNSDGVKVISPFVGGAFGAGLRPQYEAVLAVLGARALSRSVRLVLTRQQMYGLGYRPATIERLALGANADGTLASVAHEAIAMTSRYEEFSRNDTAWSGTLYKSPNARYSHKLVRLDLPTSCDMRGPGAATGVYALESAMDELAVALKLDPLELRLKCYSDRDQNEDLPFTSKALRECYRQGAEAFGWSKRTPAPRSMRDGHELVGFGMATGVWEALQMPIATRIVLSRDGRAEVSCATSDIGTGTYTVMTQIAADFLGLPLENVTIKLGDSTLPQSPVEGGSWIATSVSNAIAATAGEIRKKLFDLAKNIPDSPFSAAALEHVALSQGMIVDARDTSRAMSLVDVLHRSGADRVEVEHLNEPTRNTSYAHNTHSAVFAEVKVDEQIGVIRVTRVVSAIAAGRILNPKTASSQIMGAVVGGIGMALQEETLVDPRFGRVMNANIAEYHVPVNADVHDIKVIFVDEPDNIINPLGVKGLGEIGIVGVAAAVANAVFHATGVRVRDLPITLDKLQPHLRSDLSSTR